MEEQKEKNLLFYQENKELKNNKKLVAGLILAGGKSRRMNFNDKTFKKIDNKSLLQISIERLSPQVDLIAINSNTIGDKEEFQEIKILNDCIEGHLGPLIGLLTGLIWLKDNKMQHKWLMTVPVDSPFFPLNIVEKFFSNLQEEKVIVAQSNNRIHPVFALWSIDLLEPLKHSINKQVRKIDDFTKKIKMKVVNFPFIDYDPFFNINNEDDLFKAKKIHHSIKILGENKI